MAPGRFKMEGANPPMPGPRGMDAPVYGGVPHHENWKKIGFWVPRKPDICCFGALALSKSNSACPKTPG